MYLQLRLYGVHTDNKLILNGCRFIPDRNTMNYAGDYFRLLSTLYGCVLINSFHAFDK